MTATEQMMEMLKKNYDIADMKDFLNRYEQMKGIDIGILTQPIRKPETA